MLTAYEDDHHEVPDTVLLNRAGALGRVLFSQDDDLLVEAAHRQQDGVPFGGVVYGHQRRVSVGQCISDLEIITKVGASGDIDNVVIYLPL